MKSQNFGILQLHLQKVSDLYFPTDAGTGKTGSKKLFSLGFVESNKLFHIQKTSFLMSRYLYISTCNSNTAAA